SPTQVKWQGVVPVYVSDQGDDLVVRQDPTSEGVHVLTAEAGLGSARIVVGRVGRKRPHLQRSRLATSTGAGNGFTRQCVEQMELPDDAGLRQQLAAVIESIRGVDIQTLLQVDQLSHVLAVEIQAGGCGAGRRLHWANLAAIMAIRRARALALCSCE